jgi:hypothetical protein
MSAPVQIITTKSRRGAARQGIASLGWLMLAALVIGVPWWAGVVWLARLGGGWLR